MSKKSLYIVLAILIFVLFIKHFQGCAVETKPSVTINPKPKPSVTINPKPKPVPKIVVPAPEHLAILYDDIDKAKKIAKYYNKKLVLVFSADWCPFCKKLKSDLEHIANKDLYILCVIDIEKNKQVIQAYKLKTLPTSIVFNGDKEIQRISGYNKNSYISWLKSI